MCGCVSQLPLPHVNQQSEVSEKISSNDELVDVCNNEDPREGATEAEVECEGMLAIHVCRDGGVVHRSQGELVWFVFTMRLMSWAFKTS